MHFPAGIMNVDSEGMTAVGIGTGGAREDCRRRRKTARVVVVVASDGRKFFWQGFGWFTVSMIKNIF
jgi:hypothetical protein